MGPALERLLARPAALRLLRDCINQAPYLCLAPLSHTRQCRYITGSSQDKKAPTITKHSTSSLAQPAQRDCTLPQPWSRASRPPPKDFTKLDRSKSSKTGTEILVQSEQDGTSFERLQHEADVTREISDKPRLVDDPTHMKDTELWLQLLVFRKRTNGLRGVQDIWQAIRKRGVLVSLENEHACTLWRTLVLSALDDPPFLQGLIDHAKFMSSTGNSGSNSWAVETYEHIMGYYLRERPADSMTWHIQLLEASLVPPNPAGMLMQDFIDSKRRHEAFAALSEIYKTSKQRNLYDRFVTAMSRHSAFPFAYAWHKVLVGHRDFPSSTMRAMPVVQALFAYGNAERSEEKHAISSAKNVYKRAAKAAEAAEDKPALFSRQNMNTVVGDVYGIKEKTLGDSFCARLFATGAFSVDFVIGGLNMFGLRSIGPLALRELAARCGTTQKFNETLSVLENSTISVSNTTFAHALQRFSSLGREDVFQFLIKGDLHPDAYEDYDLQRRLLRAFLEKGALSEAYAILEIITMNKADTEAASWNLLLQTYCLYSDQEQLVRVIDDMTRRKIPVLDDTLDVVLRTRLRSRTAGHRPKTWLPGQAYKEDDLGFVTKVVLLAKKSGQRVDPVLWRELVKRYGMSYRMDELEKLLIWLVFLYSPQPVAQAPTSDERSSLDMTKASSSLATPLDLPTTHPMHPLKTIFSEHLQRAIIAWSFKSSAGALIRPARDPQVSTGEGTHRVAVKTWGRGLAMLRRLKSLGVDVDAKAVRKELVLRLWTTYGPGVSKVRLNRVEQQYTQMPLFRRLQHIQRIWGSDMFEIDPALLEPSFEAQRGLYTWLFRFQRRRFRKNQAHLERNRKQIAIEDMKARRKRQERAQEDAEKERERNDTTSLVAGDV